MDKKKFLSVIVAVTISSIAYQGTKFLTSADWTSLEDFRSEQGRFSIFMPADVKQRRRTAPSPIGPLHFTEYSSKSKHYLYMVSYTDYPPEVVRAMNIVKALDGVRDGMLRSMPGRLIKESVIKESGFPGRAIEVRIIGDGKGEKSGLIDGVDARMRAKIVLAGNRLYIIQVGATRRHITGKKANEFLESFLMDID